MFQDMEGLAPFKDISALAGYTEFCMETAMKTIRMCREKGHVARFRALYYTNWRMPCTFRSNLNVVYDLMKKRY